MTFEKIRQLLLIHFFLKFLVSFSHLFSCLPRFMKESAMLSKDPSPRGSDSFAHTFCLRFKKKVSAFLLFVSVNSVSSVSFKSLRKVLFLENLPNFY